MGEYNSTVTRVWPVFDGLFRRDPTGTTWLPALLKLGSRAGKVVQQIHSSPGRLLPELGRFELNLPGPIKKALGRERAARIARIRNAYETEIPPSATFLKWLLEHPERLVWPKRKNVEWVYGPFTQEKRKRLLAGERSAREEALKELATVGARGSQRKWWAFEGFTSVDCRLETKSLLLLIEGKRKDPISDSTDGSLAVIRSSGTWRSRKRLPVERTLPSSSAPRPRSSWQRKRGRIVSPIFRSARSRI
jgi:hypothetical protein